MQETGESSLLLLEFYNIFEENDLEKLVVALNVSDSFFTDNNSIEVTSRIPPAVLIYDSSDWGPKRDSLYIVIPITLLYLSIFITGVLGNICTCIVISRNKCMHTATNYYLFSLAVSDLLLLISGLPTEIYSTWSKYPYIFGETFCILQGFAAETSANATVLTITAFTIERYVAICHPFLSHTMSKLSRAIKFVIIIWLLAMCLALPQAMAFGIFYEQLPNGQLAKNDHYVCTVKRVVIPHAFEISTFVFFIAPMSVITVLYVLIGIRIHKSTNRKARDGSIRLKHHKTKPFIHNPNHHVSSFNDKIRLTYEEDGRKNYSRNSQSSKHVVKMLVAVVVAFFICWAPFHAQRLLAIYGHPDSESMVTMFTILTYVSGVFYYLSTTINPVLYHIMSHKFRVAFKDTIMRLLRRKRRPVGEKCYSALSGRSSQANSQSNTDSYSQQSSLRYLETEMRRLRDSRRPLVVSFRRKQAPVQKIKQVTIFDAELQKALDSLTEESQKIDKECRSLKASRSSIRKYNDVSQYEKDTWESVKPGLGLIELHNLNLSGGLPANGALKPTWQNCSNVDIEIFRQQQLKLNNTKRSYSRLNSKEFYKEFENVDRILTKSVTLPNINEETPNSFKLFLNS